MTIRHHRGPRPFWAGFRSLVLPGWGQIVTDHRALGWTLLSCVVATGVALGALVVVLGPGEVVARLSDPTLLLGLLAINVLVAAVRLGATVHAWWAGGGRNVVAITALAILVLVPHVALGWVGAETRDTLVSVFTQAPEPAPVVPTATPTTTTSTVPTVTTTTAPVLASPPPSTATTVTTTTTTVPATTTTTTIPYGDGRLTVLLLGGDAGPGRPGLRTDTMMVATVDTTTGAAALFGLPRNFGGITFSDGTAFPKGRTALLNEVYGWGVDHPAAFGGIDPGAAAVKDVAEHITGLPIDHFALVDLTGFPDVVDAFGGVVLDVPRTVDGPLYDPTTGGYEMITIPAGEQRLDGDEALAYSRARIGSSDYVRMGRQRCVLTALVEQADPIRTFARLPAILDTIEANVTTDIPLDVVPDLLRLAQRVEAGEVRVVGFDRSWRSGWTANRLAIPDIERIRAAVFQTLVDPDLAADQSGILTADEEC